MAVTFGALSIARLGAAFSGLSQARQLAAAYGDGNEESRILCKQIVRELKEAEKVLDYAITLTSYQRTKQIDGFPTCLETQTLSLMQSIEDCRLELLKRQRGSCGCAAGCVLICGGGSTIKTLQLVYQDLSRRVARCTGPVEALVKENPKYDISVDFQKARRILVYGEVGTGKSTLIQELTGLGEEEVKTGLAHRGVTKEITQFFFRLNGHLMALIDCPGVGDRDVPVGVVVDRLSEKFDQQKGKLPGRFSAIMFVKSASEPRFQMGAQFVSKVLGLAFGADKQAWGTHAMIVGTKADTIKADEQSVHLESLQSLGRDFMMEAGADVPDNFDEQQVCLKRKGDVEGVRACLLRIIEQGGKELQFVKPKEDDIFDAFYSVHGGGKSREELKKEFREDFQRPRQRDCLTRAQKAVDAGNLLELVEHVNFLQVLCNEADTDEDIKRELQVLQNIRDRWQKSVSQMEHHLDSLIGESQHATDVMADLFKQAAQLQPKSLGLLQKNKIGVKVRAAKRTTAKPRHQYQYMPWMPVDQPPENILGTTLDKQVEQGRVSVRWEDGTCRTHAVNDLEEVALSCPALDRAEAALQKLKSKFQLACGEAAKVPYQADHQVQSKLRMLDSVIKGQEQALICQEDGAKQQHEMMLALDKKDSENMTFWKKWTTSNAELEKVKRDNQRLVGQVFQKQTELDRMHRDKYKQVHQDNLSKLKEDVQLLSSDPLSVSMPRAVQHVWRASESRLGTQANSKAGPASQPRHRAWD